MKFGIIRNVTTDIMVVRIVTTWSGRWPPTFWGKFRLCLPSEDRDIVFH